PGAGGDGGVSRPGGARLRVAQVSVYRDPRRRTPNELLRAWRTLGDCAEAASGAGLDVTVVQAAWTEQTLERNGVSYRFVPPAGLLSRLRSLRPDLVHFQGLSFPLWLRRLRRALPRVPVLVQDHAGA